MTNSSQRDQRDVPAIEWAVKACAAAGLFLMLPTLLQFGNQIAENEMLSVRYPVEVTFLLIAASVAAGLLLVLNAAIWIGYGRRDGRSWLDRTYRLRSRIMPMLVVIALIWVVTTALMRFAATIALPIAANLSQIFLLAAVCSSLALLGMRVLSAGESDSRWDRLEARLLSALERPQVQTLLLGIGLALVLGLLVMGALQAGLLSGGMLGDQTISLYASQTLARGAGPYEEYIILHPPMAYLPGALALGLGRAFGLEDVIALRLGMTVMILIAAVLVYLVTVNFTRMRSAGMIAAAAFGWNALWLVNAAAPAEKIVVVLFSLMMIFAMQKQRWFWAGVFALASVMGWAGAIVLLPAPLLVVLCQKGNTRLRDLGAVLGGGAVFAGLMLLYLVITGAAQTFWQQYMITMSRFLIDKVTFQPNPYLAEISRGTTFFQRLTALTLIDRLLLVLGSVAITGFVIDQVRRHGLIGGLRAMLAEVRHSPLLVTGALLIGGVLIDMQSYIDLVPIIPILSIFLGWLISHIMMQWMKQSAAAHAGGNRVMVAGLIVAIVLLARFLTPLPVSPISLAGQRAAAAWIEGLVEPQDKIEALGDLSVVVLNQRMNATRIIHLGPKTALSMESEGITLRSAPDLVMDADPRLIIVDNRNLNQPYLQSFLRQLGAEYDSVDMQSPQWGVIRVYYRAGDTQALLAACGLGYALANPEMAQGDSALREDDLRSALGAYQAGRIRNRNMVNLSMIQAARAQLNRDNTEVAVRLLETASRVGRLRVWGLLEAANHYAATGEEAEALRTYESALADYFEMPDSFTLRGPAVFSPTDLLDAAHPAALSIDRHHQILAYDVERIDEQVLLTLWWWTSFRTSPIDGRVLIQWVTADGDPIGEPVEQPMLFYPEAGVHWSYLLDVPAGIEDGAPLAVRIALMPRDAEADADADADAEADADADAETILSEPLILDEK